MTTPPRTKTERFLRLAGMTTRVATRYAASRLRSLVAAGDEAQDLIAAAHEASGRRIAETLGELKGAVMKVGQMASIGTDWLPAELAGPLRVLQKGAPPVELETIAGQIESELGAPPEELFSRFDPEPFASASIGQVHRACTDDGREVVVKVQYPGVDASVDSDLAQLRLALKAAGLIRLPRHVMRELFAELSRQLHAELDYTNEAANVRLLRQLHEGDRDVVMPDVVGERSSQRVLTLTYEPGVLLSDVTSDRFDQRTRDLVGLRLAQLLAREIFVYQVLHADPNPANFAVRPDATLVVYDFGCVKRLPDHLIRGYRDVIHAIRAEDPAAVDQALLDIGARNPQVPQVDAEVYRAFLGIFRPIFADDGPFDFGAAAVQSQMLALMPRLRHQVEAFQPPVQGVLVNRVVAGHYGNLHRLGARVRVMELLSPYLSP